MFYINLTKGEVLPLYAKLQEKSRKMKYSFHLFIRMGGYGYNKNCQKTAREVHISILKFRFFHILRYLN